ncbi:MAG: Na+/H+ antiporter NhaA [Akkermansiaceae bacterium]|jgi:Na+:H+ antiporter, NhaA family|nr:Na+/H+ antiporter NhaA [Akkermansiaceae bacterium]MDP4646733.1 Na+/H+ antiporter NhaA [Akkermansiaceae bacterium]MDP4721058.1 Na+/H+ antiporter NhaA [Akkermansiaceae bacterium]MDP4779649.1 Na+/H+ antiporter NhaA [Akkermansiaceae bacterium]MDP4846271.1 Na+/H+ antiporter NhaA [Akkermansiaceae bacterium]
MPEYKLTKTFQEFFKSEKSSGFVLIACALVSLLVANSAFSESYLAFWKMKVAGLTVAYWVNDGLMAIFFLLIGLELKRELYKGELSDLKSAMLPIFAALGGIAFPALIHFGFNIGLPTAKGFGIPMATDIAFALTVLALVGSRAPTSLKVFLTAVAVIDDLCAIIVIALFYSAKFSVLFFGLSMAVLVVLAILNRRRVMSLPVYLIGGALMWFFMLQSGIHATIAGVLLAFTIPFTPKQDDVKSPSYIMEHNLHKPVAFLIMPIFALCNTGIVIGADWAATLASPNSSGIISGLLLGKIFGVSLFSFAAVKMGVCKLPMGMGWRHVTGAGLLAGIGFTMSIFITNLAYKPDTELINSSIMAVLIASVASGVLGYLWLFFCGRLKAA